MFVSRDRITVKKHNHPPAFHLVGNTPLIELNLSLLDEFKDIRVFAKLEMYNHGGSVKDRPSLYMIEAAEAQGLLEGKEILEPTSGNTGIGLAWIGALKGYKVNLVMPSSMSQERIDILSSYGAKVILTSGENGMDGAIQTARRMVNENPHQYFMLDQFNNTANWKAHFFTTGPEIWEQTKHHVDYLVVGFGTGGTLMGTGRYLRSKSLKTKLIGVEPAADTIIPGLKNMNVVEEIPSIFNAGELDEIISVSSNEARAMMKRLASEMSLLVGPSSGAALSGILKFVRQSDECIKGIIVTIFPDSAKNYLSQGIIRG